MESLNQWWRRAVRFSSFIPCWTTAQSPDFVQRSERMGVRIVRPEDGASFDFGGLGVRWKIDGAETGERFAVVHDPIAPNALAAPLHFHRREDELSYVLRGTLGALLGDDVVTAEQGAWVFKPRGQWHTFWNAGDTPFEIIEVISPAGLENYFREAVALLRKIRDITVRIGDETRFTRYLASVRATHKPKRNFMKLLDEVFAISR